MKNLYRCISIVLLITISLSAAGCSNEGDFFSRNYRDDIVIPLSDGKGDLIIREWSWLQGSGEEIYLLKDGKEKLLGTCNGADDGYCPFEYGKYKLIQNEDSIEIS